MNRLLLILLLAAATAHGQINNPPTSVNIVDSTATGRAVLTATNAAAAATAIGLGTTNDVTFSELSVSGGGTTNPAIKLGNSLTGFSASQSPSTIRTIAGGSVLLTLFGGGFSVTPLANFSTNVTVGGSLTATGNATLNGVNNTMPNATNAASASSLMTRVLTDNNPIQTIGTVRPLGAFGFNTNGGGSAAANHAFGGADVRGGTNTNGYGRASLYRGLNNNNNFTGAGISAQNMSISFLFAVNDTITTNSVVRLIVGSGGFQNAAPLLAPANSNALSARGFGVEIARTSTTNVHPSATLRARLFAHDGTNYYTSSYTDDFFAFSHQQQFIVNYTTNGTVTLQTSSSSVAPSRPSATPVLTLTNGPTTTFGGAFIDFATVNRSDIAPAASLHTIYYGGMVEVKD